MNKTEFIEKLSDKTDYTKKDLDTILKATLELIEDEVASGESISFIGFGTFLASERGERKSRNPRTGEEITIPATRVPKLKVGSEFKRKVAGK